MVAQSAQETEEYLSRYEPDRSAATIAATTAASCQGTLQVAAAWFLRRRYHACPSGHGRQAGRARSCPHTSVYPQPIEPGSFDPVRANDPGTGPSGMRGTGSQDRAQDCKFCFDLEEVSDLAIAWRAARNCGEGTHWPDPLRLEHTKSKCCEEA